MNKPSNFSRFIPTQLPYIRKIFQNCITYIFPEIPLRVPPGVPYMSSFRYIFQIFISRFLPRIPPGIRRFHQENHPNFLQEFFQGVSFKTSFRDSCRNSFQDSSRYLLEDSFKTYIRKFSWKSSRKSS